MEKMQNVNLDSLTPCSAENDERQRVGFPMQQFVM
jgi:hypothetical protein